MTSSVWPGWLALTLNALGAALVGASIVGSHSAERPVWVLIAGLVAVAAWAARSVCTLLGARHAVLALSLLSAAAGAVVTPATDGVAVVPVVVSILVLLGDTGRPLAWGLGTAAGSAVLIVAAAVPFDTAVVAVLGELAGVVLALFAGLSRRQFRRSEQQAALLRDREAAMREEAARVALARDLHDVLAHSLGGLVLQLEAADALLEAGDTEAARRRVVDARGLAVDGLAEARRAVAALRQPAPATVRATARATESTTAPARVTDPPLADAHELTAAIDRLLTAHRTLGGTADLAIHGLPRPLDADHASALQRALQEALSNARKHAPGQPVAVDLDWQDDRVTLRIANDLPGGDAAGPGALAATGGGHGLAGMRERFAALRPPGSATAGVVDGRFVVTAETRRR